MPDLISKIRSHSSIFSSFYLRSYGPRKSLATANLCFLFISSTSLLAAIGTGNAAALPAELSRQCNKGVRGGAINLVDFNGQVTRTATIDLVDREVFVPAEVSVREGETVRFIFKNSLFAEPHSEVAAASERKGDERRRGTYSAMSAFESNGMAHDGRMNGEFIWRFTESSRIKVACLQFSSSSIGGDEIPEAIHPALN